MRGDTPPGNQAPAPPGQRPSADLARQLTGDLPCAGCGYNLRSASIRGVCPECGTAVRATILARIDPFAEVLRPITYPVLTAAGLMVWCIFAFVAALLVWSLRAADACAVLMDARVSWRGAATIAMTASLTLSGLGALTLIRPHARIPLRQMLAAAAGAAAILAMAYVSWHLHGRFDPVRTRPYFQPETLIPARNLLRLAFACLVLAAIFGLRPNLRLLATRSLVMRMGRVDRQTMLAMAAAIGVAAVGDALHVAAGYAYAITGVLYVAGFALIALGSMLLTVGLAGMIVDCLRLVPVILRQPISMTQVLDEPANNPAP